MDHWNIGFHGLWNVIAHILIMLFHFKKKKLKIRKKKLVSENQILSMASISSLKA